MLSDFAVYRLSDGYIDNVIWYDPDAAYYTPPEGHGMVEIPGEDGLAGEWSMCGTGWSYIDGQFVEPPNPYPTPDTTQPEVDGAQTL